VSESKRAEPVVEAHHNDVAVGGEAGAVVPRYPALAGAEGAAVNSLQHRPLPSSIRGGDVQRQTNSSQRTGHLSVSLALSQRRRAEALRRPNTVPRPEDGAA
jgi:hypothetical protein